jgi:glutathione synthase/RimK-type ligase-like ATP-grasp enzyme
LAVIEALDPEFETEDGLSINEINHTPEFKGLQTVSERDIAEAMLAYCVNAQEGR